MARPQITVSVPAGLGTYKVFYGSGSGSYSEGYAELHFYPAIGSDVEWNIRSSITVTYNNGRQSDHYENLDRWNGFTWMEQDFNDCHLANYYLAGTASYISSYKVNVTIYGTPNAFTYQIKEGTGTIKWLHRNTTVEWESRWDSSSQTTIWTRTGKVTAREIDYRIEGDHPYVPGRREGEDREFYGSMYGPCISAFWNNSGPEPDTVNSNGPTYNYKDGSFQDRWYHDSTYDYNYKHNNVWIYFWRPWIWVSCDYTDNARWDERQDYDPVHYPGATPPACSPEGLLSVYLDLSTYQHLSPGGGLPTPSWPGHELCVNPNYPGATWFDRSSITSTGAHGIYELCNLTSQSDHMLYCAWRNLSSEVDVYCYSPSQSKYIDFRSGDYPAHNPDPATGASVYKYGSYSRLILSGPVGTDGWHYKYEIENGRRVYFYVYGSTSQGQYKYLSSGTDNGHSFQSDVTPYDNEEYFFYTDGYDHTIVFNFKKNGGFTYLPMYYPGSNVLIRGVKTNLPIRDGDG